MYVKEFNSILTSRVKKSFCVLLVVVTGFSKKPYFKPLLLRTVQYLFTTTASSLLGSHFKTLLIANSFDKTLQQPSTLSSKIIQQQNGKVKLTRFEYCVSAYHAVDWWIVDSLFGLIFEFSVVL